MSRVKKSMKQKMAAFLAVCMTAGSLPTGMVTAAETRERPEDANLAEIIEFDPVKLKDAMEKAADLAGMTSYAVIELDQDTDELSAMLDLLSENDVSSDAVAEALKELYNDGTLAR